MKSIYKKSELNMSHMIFIGLTVALIVSGQLLLKSGVNSLTVTLSSLSDLPNFLFALATNIQVILGLFCAFAAAITWMIVLSQVDLSFAYPFMALPIVLVLAIAGVLFGEHVSIMRWTGVAIVCIGLFLSARG